MGLGGGGVVHEIFQRILKELIKLWYNRRKEITCRYITRKLQNTGYLKILQAFRVEGNKVVKNPFGLLSSTTVI
jgi:23S rRNA A2030 N6-methylase RlmJ